MNFDFLVENIFKSLVGTAAKATQNIQQNKTVFDTLSKPLTTKNKDFNQSKTSKNKNIPTPKSNSEFDFVIDKNTNLISDIKSNIIKNNNIIYVWTASYGNIKFIVDPKSFSDTGKQKTFIGTVAPELQNTYTVYKNTPNNFQDAIVDIKTHGKHKTKLLLGYPTLYRHFSFSLKK
jgi:dsDNA-specific endonuclease/ATPase MutS2